MSESLLEEMKRYIGFTSDDAAMLASLASVVEPHLPALANRFYEQIPRHPEAAAVFTGGEAQIDRLKLTLQRWARGLFSGVYDSAYADERFRIGYRHVQIGLPQRYVRAAMHIVSLFLSEVVDREISEDDRRRRAQTSLARILILDLSLICEAYFEASIRELRQLNDRLESTNRSLEQANRAKDDFLATTSHELRTPLTAIIGFARLLLDGYVTDPREQRDLLADVHGSALNLLSLVDDILDLSRIEAGRLDVVLETVDLRALIADVGSLTKVQAHEKGLALLTAVPDELPHVRADRSRLRQVLLNVIGNAIKFTHDGEVRIVATSESEGSEVRVDVTDTGIGIAPEDQPLLFQKFRQIDTSYTRKQGGAGLGLAISRALIERMSGRIQVQSEGKGRGTIVTLTVPSALERVETPATRPLRERPPGPAVLLVGHEPHRRRIIAAALKSAGYAVREGATSDGVRAMLRVDPPDVLLVDLAPASDEQALREWLDLIVALHADPRTKVRPILLTDRSDGTALSVQLELLASRPAIIDQPLDPDRVRQIMDRVVSRAHPAPFRVLVGDDDPLVFKFVASVLPAHDYVVLRAGSSSEVLRAVETQPFDALLLDLRMPDGSGYDVIRSLKVEGRAPDLPILVITNYPVPADVEEAQLLSSPLVLEVLPKPLVAEQPEVLLERLKTMRSAS